MSASSNSLRLACAQHPASVIGPAFRSGRRRPGGPWNIRRDAARDGCWLDPASRRTRQQAARGRRRDGRHGHRSKSARYGVFTFASTGTVVSSPDTMACVSMALRVLDHAGQAASGHAGRSLRVLDHAGHPSTPPSATAQHGGLSMTDINVEKALPALCRNG
jgi:hypothetical protein